MIETVRTSETSAYTKETTRRYIPEGSNPFISVYFVSSQEGFIPATYLMRIKCVAALVTRSVTKNFIIKISDAQNVT
jgi:hypothetical protein